MANNKLTQTNSRFLYETATAAAPTSWQAVSEGYTWTDNGRLFRVTADEALFDTVAYVAQRTNESGDYEDAVTVSLNVPDGCGVSRVDSFSTALVSGSEIITHTTLSLLDTFDRHSAQDREAHEQQVELERNIGMIFNYLGEKYRGTMTSRSDSKDSESGGFLEGFDASILTSRKQWSDAGLIPTLGVGVKSAGVKYRIQDIIKSPAHYQLNLVKKHGG